MQRPSTSIRVLSRRAIALIGLAFALGYAIWIAGPYLRAIIVRDAAVTSWIAITTAPVAGYTLRPLHPGGRAPRPTAASPPSPILARAKACACAVSAAGAGPHRLRRDRARPRSPPSAWPRSIDASRRYAHQSTLKRDRSRSQQLWRGRPRRRPCRRPDPAADLSRRLRPGRPIRRRRSVLSATFLIEFRYMS